ncbi:MAG: RNA polymerase sigma factor [Bacteroidales bacterium]|nr:RNA polymerase sigma factor [Bacteroidales bacterium]
MIKGICERYAANGQDAEDLFHDTFVFILTHFKDYKNISSLNGWLRTITINKAIDHYRRQQRRQTDDIESADYADPAAPVMGNETLTMAQLLRYINELPDKYRTAFNLYVIDGISQNEIVVMMNESHSNVRSLISRAKSILRKKIQNYLNNEEFQF